MHRLEKRLSWLAAALTLGLVSMPGPSASKAVEEGKAIDRLPEIRAALRGALEEDVKSSKPSGLGKLLAQWGNWPNWSNWGNG